MATKQWTPKTKEELKKLVDGGVSLADIDTIFVDDMSGLFKDSTRTDFSGIEEWNVSNVENMSAMFRNAKHFNANINSWNVSKVTRMDSMFEGAESFNQPLDKWDVSNVRLFDSMFEKAKAFNQNINTWVFNNSYKKYEYYHYFYEKWRTIDYISIKSMFEGAESFSSSIDDWNIKKLSWSCYKSPEKVCLSPVSFDDTSTDNKYTREEKEKWEKELKKEIKDIIFSNSPLASNPPKWYNEWKKNEKETFIKQYKAREEYVADYIQKEEEENEQRRKNEEQRRKENEALRAKWQAEETEEKVKKWIWIGLGVAALLYFFIK